MRETDNKIDEAVAALRVAHDYAGVTQIQRQFNISRRNASRLFEQAQTKIAKAALRQRLADIAAGARMKMIGEPQLVDGRIFNHACIQAFCNAIDERLSIEVVRSDVANHTMQEIVDRLWEMGVRADG